MLEINLLNRRALVTGVSSGIGAGIAAALAQAGCDVAGCGLEAADSVGAQAFAQSVAAAGRQAHYQTADVADAVQATAFVRWAAERFGGLDLVVSNAGRNVFRGAADCDDAAWETNIALNLAAHWRVAQAAKPYFDQSQAPVYVAIASNHAYRTLPGCFPYNVAKAGIVAMIQSLALEWGPHCRAVGVAPGFIDTALADAWFDGFADPHAKRAQVAAVHPVGRRGTPQDIGALVAFLCSPLAGFISGTTILADGGRSAVMQDG